LQKEGLPKQSLPPLYRFCLLMMGDATKAQEVFQSTMHEAALRAEEVEMEEHEISAKAPSQIARLEPAQLAIWIAGAPEPQRTALALFYLDQFDHEDLLALTELKTAEFARHIANGRQQFQGWLNATFPLEKSEPA